MIQNKRNNSFSAEVIDENVKEEDISLSSYRVPFKSIANGSVSIPTITEFKNLKQYEDELQPRYVTNSDLGTSSFPFEHNRIKLQNAIGSNNYINANWITRNSDECNYDSAVYSSNIPYRDIRFAISRTPLSATMKHHYHMIRECMFDTVIGFSEEVNKNPFLVGKVYHFDDLTVKVLNRIDMTLNLTRTEMTLFDKNAPEYQINHKFIYFEFTAWPKNEIRNFQDTEFIVSAICMIRDEMMRGSRSLPKVLVHDSFGGVRGSAVFLAMYQLMNEVDEAFKADDMLKQYVKDADVFGTINRLREDRKNMVDEFITYKLLHQCLAYYGSNRKTLSDLVFKTYKKKVTGSNIDEEYVMYQNSENVVNVN